MANPADVVLSIFGHDLTVRPVAHAVEPGIALDHQGDGIGPRSGPRSPRSRNPASWQTYPRHRGRPDHPRRVSPRNRALYVSGPTTPSKVFSNVCAPGNVSFMAEGQRWNPRGLERVGRGEKVVNRHRVADFDAVVGHDLLVVPEPIAAVDADGNRVLLAFPRRLLDQTLWHDICPAFGFVDIGDRLAIAWNHVAGRSILGQCASARSPEVACPAAASAAPLAR